FANRGAGGDDVVDHQHPAAGQPGTDQLATLAMGLGFLAVEGDRQVASAPRVLACQCGRQRDALVGGAEQQVEPDAGGVDRVRVTGGEPGQGGARVEASGIEEVGAGAPRLEGELAKAQRVGAKREVEEAGAVVVQGGGGGWLGKADDNGARGTDPAGGTLSSRGGTAAFPF